MEKQRCQEPLFERTAGGFGSQWFLTPLFTRLVPRHRVVQRSEQGFPEDMQ